MTSDDSESELLARELDSVGHKIAALDARVREIEAVVERLEVAARTTARGLEEVSTHWDAVYRAMRRAE